MDDPSPSSGRNENNNKKTVRFNVGGTIYEVSRSLLEQHSDTMLARLASDTWSFGKQGDDSEALFIERNGERFQYCLDYMRDGGVVNLPSTVSKEALLQDLAYYGFCDVDPSRISVNVSTNHCMAFFERLDSLERKFREEEGELEKEKKELDEKLFVVKVALRCIEALRLIQQFYVSWSKYDLKIDMRRVGGEALKDFSLTIIANSSQRQQEFNEIIKPLGLKYKDINRGIEYIILDYL